MNNNLDLFQTESDSSDAHQNLSLPDSDIKLFPNLYSASEATQIFEGLHKQVRWSEERIKLYGKEHKIPRLMAWYGNPSSQYTFSGKKFEPEPWFDILLSIKHKIAEHEENEFNSALVNLYRDGNDGVAWHSDDEAELGHEPCIVSLSFGETREFQLKHKTMPGLAYTIRLPAGCMLIMKGSTQRYWLHQIPKRKHIKRPRINITFRKIIGNN